MKTLLLILTMLSSLVLISCEKNVDALSSQEATTSFEFKGLLKKQGVTTYMYGTHVISNESRTYALKSTTVNLDSYVDKTVTIKGNKINGYPVDGGPEYIDVKSVE